MSELIRLKQKAKEQGWVNWIRSKADEKAVLKGCYFDVKEAEYVKQFIENFIKHTTGRRWAGKDFILEDWQYKNIIAPLYGWRRQDGRRRYRRGYISTPKKCGKTSLASSLILLHLIADLEPSANVYSASVTRDQAAKLFRDANKMVMASPELRSMLRVVDSTKTIIHPETNSFFRALSSEANSTEGIDASFLVYDELHAAKSRDLYEALEYSGAARDQPLMLVITTAGSDTSTNSVCHELYNYSKRLDELEDESFFSCIYEAAKEDDWADPLTWQKANPMLGVSIDFDDFKADFERAKATPAKENSFRRYRLNQWIDDTGSAFFNMEQWDKNTLPLDPEELDGAECFAGLDLSSRVDLTSLVLLFPQYEPDNPAPIRYDVLPFFWSPREGARTKQREDGVPYLDWARQNYLELTEGSYVDQRIIRDRINELGSKFRIKEIACDDWNAAKLMTEMNYDGFNVVNFRQGFKSMNDPTKHLEGLILDQKLNHFGNPVLRWNAKNTLVITDPAGNLKPTKAKMKTQRIDGIVALIMALGLADLRTESKYESGGIEYF